MGKKATEMQIFEESSIGVDGTVESERDGVSHSSDSISPSDIGKIADQDPKKPPPPIDRNRMDEMRKVFSKYDANGDGRISSDELRSCLRALGYDASPPQLRQAMEEMDKNGDGYIDLNEFAAFHSAGGGSSDPGSGIDGCPAMDRPELREAFGVYDKNRNGLISASELHEVMKQLGEKVSLKDCTRMIKTVDLDGDGSVNFEEFVMMMTNPRSSTAS